MPKELDQDTLDALEAQGGIQDDGTKGGTTDSTDEVPETSVSTDLPDITIQDVSTDGDGEDPSQGDIKDPDAGDKGEPETSTADKAVNKSLSEAGFSEEELAERIKTDDGISDALVQELKEKIDPDFVDAHVGRLRAEYKLAKLDANKELSKMQAQNDTIVQMNDFIYETVGSKENFNAMGTLLKENLDTSELAALNVKLASQNKIVIKEALTST